MDITPYVESLRRDLTAAADAGSEEVRAAADRLLLALEPAARLALMEAISQAAAEITSDLPAGSVDVRLHGRELDFLVQVPAPAPTAPTPPPPPAPAPTENPEADGGLARVTLRLPEAVKSKAEERAVEAGQSLNTWMVGAIRAAAREAAIRVDLDMSSLPFLGDSQSRHDSSSGRRMTGWL